jgi:hypothetical protein
MTIDTQDKLVAGRAGTSTGLAIPVQKATIISQAAGTMVSLWRSSGAQPLQPAIPGAAAICTNDTPGALKMPTQLGGNSFYIDEVNLACTIAGAIDVMDRIIQSGGLSGAVVTAQAVNTPALPARAPAAYLEWYLECYTLTGGTSTTATVAVTYSDATTGTIAVTFLANLPAGRLLPIIPTNGKAIASVQSVTLTATTGVAGNFGVTAVRRVGVMSNHAVANIPDVRSYLLRGVAADACLSLHCNTSANSTGDVRGHIIVIQG